MAVKIFQVLSLLLILSGATTGSCNLIAEGAGTPLECSAGMPQECTEGMPQPDKEPGFYKIFNAGGYLTATADGKVTQTPEGSSWLVQCNQGPGTSEFFPGQGTCDMANVERHPMRFYGRLDDSGPVLESSPAQGYVQLNTNITDHSPAHWKIRPAVAGGGWDVTSAISSGYTGYLLNDGDQMFSIYVENVAPGEDLSADEFQGDTWSFEKIANVGSSA